MLLSPFCCAVRICAGNSRYLGFPAIVSCRGLQALLESFDFPYMESREELYVSEINGRGCVKGITIIDSETSRPKCHRLGGVPYARPLTKAQRWKRARALPKDFKYGKPENPTDFTGLSAECPQSGAPFETPHMKEDCLQCNIWTPAGTPPDGGWPVWIYIRTLSSS